MRHNDKLGSPRQGFKLGMGSRYADAFAGAKGKFLIELRDSRTGELLHYLEKENVITLDGGVLAAVCFHAGATSAQGISMLAVGTGATGPMLNPDVADPRQRHLNNELVAPSVGRKTFASATFRTAGGLVSSVPTNIVDFTTSFGDGEAVGGLNEMGLIRPFSPNPLVTTPVPSVFPAYDPTIDLNQYDIMVNYLPFPVISKPNMSVLTITWRLSF